MAALTIHSVTVTITMGIAITDTISGMSRTVTGMGTTTATAIITPPTMICSTFKLALGCAFCALLMALAPVYALDRDAQPSPANAGAAERLISFVLLLNQPRQLDEHQLADALNHALDLHGAGEAGDLIVSKPPYYLVKAPGGRVVVSSIDKPYFERDDKFVGQISNAKLRNAVQHHHAWIGVDSAEKANAADLRATYQQLGKIAAALSGPDTIAIFAPDVGQIAALNDEIAQQLRSDDPLQAFAPNGDAQVVAVSDQDPRLKKAENEAKQHWSEFMQAFKNKEGAKFAVKGRIAEGDEAEYMWLSVTDIDENEVHGMLDNEPARLSKLKMGEDLHIKVSEVDDWMYVGRDQQPRGGFTIKALEKATAAATPHSHN